MCPLLALAGSDVRMGTMILALTHADGPRHLLYQHLKTSLNQAYLLLLGKQ